jgi:hypothetical protein
MSPWTPIAIGELQRPEKKGAHVVLKLALSAQPPEAWQRQFNRLATTSSLKPPVICAGDALTFEIRFGDRQAEEQRGTEILGYLASTNQWYVSIHLPAVDEEDQQKRLEAHELAAMQARLEAQFKAPK